MKFIKSFSLFEKLSDFDEITIVYIRTADNTYSSKDKSVHMLGPFEKAIKIVKANTPRIANTYQEKYEIDGKIYLVNNVLVAQKSSLHTLRNGGYSAEEINTFYKRLIDNGFSDGIPDLLKDVIEQKNVNDDIVREKDRTDKEYVLTKSYRKKHDIKDYVGGFDLDIFFKEHLISYVERGLVFGYIGHSCRKVWVDKLLSEICLPHINADAFAGWLTSTSGRHFGDAIEDMVEKDQREEVKKYIMKYLPAIHDQAIIYNSPEHKGHLGSSKEIFNKYKDMGMMMGDSYDWIPF